MPRSIDQHKRGFAIVDSRRVKELFINLKPTLRTKATDDDQSVYTLTVEVTVGKHDRSAIVSAFRRLGVWFEEEIRPEEDGGTAEEPEKEATAPRKSKAA